MKKLFLTFCMCTLALIQSNAQQLKSPDGRIEMTFSLLSDGAPAYSLRYKKKEVIKLSKLGLELKNDKRSLLNGFNVKSAKKSSFDETWTPVWGEVSQIRNNYNEL